MKVISLLQPWATLVVMGAKKIETRSWNTKHTGDLLIHASLNDKAARELTGIPGDETFKRFIRHSTDLKYGCIIGKVNLLQTGSTENFVKLSQDKHRSGWHATIDWETELKFGDYSPNRFGWILSDAVKFKKPTPASGTLGLWNFDESLLLTIK